MRQPKSLARWLLGVIVGSLFLASAGRAAGPEVEPARTVRVEPTALLQAPPLTFAGGTDWINSGPLTAADLKGKIVLLDFWTYCCINCHHVLPDLARLEQKYRNELVVIGVHSPKFFAERDTTNIREKVHEYQIKHPVVNDADMAIWNRYGVNSWPTLALFDVDGTLVGGVGGEGHYDLIDREIAKLVERHRKKGDLNTAPVHFSPESDKPESSPLSYPGKVHADEKGKRLFIADTAHNRIVQCGLDGSKPLVIGNGAAGLVDGDYARAQFNRPQGMCLVGETLYVADTENHALRAIDLKSRKVTTAAGTGQQSHHRTGGGPARTTGLNSPWDVVPIPGPSALAIAMAGIHQIWRYEPPSGLETTGHIAVWAGTGAENIQDGPLPLALFSQPSGLATDGHVIFVADSEVSAIRELVPEKRKSYVQTIVGQGLFVFADVDGRGQEVRLQHCLGVAWGNGHLYIADTYNNKIKVCDPKARVVETLVGSGQPGKTDAPPRFYQPGGLSVAGKSLYVADTNNGLIRVVDLDAKTVRTLEIEGLTPPSPPRRKPVFPNAQVAALGAQKVGPGSSLALKVALPLAEGYKVSPDVPMPYLVETPGSSGILTPAASDGQKLETPAQEFTLKVDLARPLRSGETFPMKLSVAAFVCSKTSSLCTVKNFVWTFPVAVEARGPDEIVLLPESK